MKSQNWFFTVVLFLSAFGLSSARSFTFAQVQQIYGDVNVSGTVDIGYTDSDLAPTGSLTGDIQTDDTNASADQSTLINQRVGSDAFRKNSNYYQGSDLDANGYHKTYFSWSSLGTPNTYKDNTNFVINEDSNNTTYYGGQAGENNLDRSSTTNSFPFQFNLMIPSFNWTDFKTDCQKAIFGSNTGFFTTTLNSIYNRNNSSDYFRFHYNINAFNSGIRFQNSASIFGGAANNGIAVKFGNDYAAIKNIFTALVCAFCYFFTFRVILSF